MLTVALAFFPIILLFVLMIGLKMPALRAVPLVWFATLFIAVLYWQMPLEVIGAANVKGLLTTLDIIIILFGAIFLLEVLKQSGFVSKIDGMLKRICSDKRIAVIIIGWSFVCLIEGAAGFGTPAALAAPLIASMGINPAAAVAITLIADSAPVSFGALGTPINIGVREAVLGADEIMLSQVAIHTALIHAIIGMLIPFTMLLVLAHFEKKPLADQLPLLPFCLFAAASFVVPYFVVANTLGYIFPSLIGGIISLICVFAAAKYGWFLPAQKRKPKFDFKNAARIFSPYILATTTLIISKWEPVLQFLKSLSIDFVGLFGTQISHVFSPLTNPGLAFFSAAILTIVFMKLSKNKIQTAVSNTWEKGIYTFIALAFTIGLVQMLLNSGNNYSNIESVPIVIAQFLSGLFGEMYIFAAPQIGLFGAFLAGSNTVSNIFFAGFQQSVAIELGLSVVLILALQVVGGAAGNMIVIHNIIAASATVGLKGEEGKIISINLIPALAYGLLASIIVVIIMSPG